MKNYLGFHWVLDGAGWVVSDTLEEAKKVWCLGMSVFEINADDKQEFVDYARKMKSNRLVIDKLKERNCPLVYQEGEIPETYMAN